MSVASHHAEWLSLMDVSGPFLSLAVLCEAMPNGLDAHDPALAAELRAAYDAWSEPELGGFDRIPPVELHLAWTRFVMHRVLGFSDDALSWDEPTLAKLVVEPAPPGGGLRPDAVVLDDGRARLLLSIVGPSVATDEPLITGSWAASPQERMVELLRANGCHLGLVTDGERWTLVSLQLDEVPGFTTWWASLWREERITLQSFRTLLRESRFLSVPEAESPEGLLARSAEDQRGVTTKLGSQTLEAVEILIRTIDHLDRDRGGQLLADVNDSELYDAAVTVMMRLIFLLFAEENDLLPTDEPLYNERYAVSTLRARLQEVADQAGEEVLETTSDAWPRLLAAWRAVFGGVQHADMVLAPYGGSLFDPDRYPFLEGRLPASSWSDTQAEPLAIDNRTVLHLLNALQTLEEGGQRRGLSFRALDVEQIGHVYEGMLDHTAVHADGWILGLSGTGGKEPEISLDVLESLDEKSLIDVLVKATGRQAASVKKWLAEDSHRTIEKAFPLSWNGAFGGDGEVADRARRFARLLRSDTVGGPLVIAPGAVYVADSSHRGATGTHYTPRFLTEEMVRRALDSLVHVGSVDKADGDVRQLRTPAEILELRVCDPACGSGAFLVEACRFLATKLVESRLAHGEASSEVPEALILDARREVAERCLHGVDINPMACEMAKLSLWLVTLAKDRPFTFVDHAIRCGDSLIGVLTVEQLKGLRFRTHTGRETQSSFWAAEVESEIGDALDAHAELTALTTGTFSDLLTKERLHDSQVASQQKLFDVADRLVYRTLLQLASDDRRLDSAMAGIEQHVLSSNPDLDASGWSNGAHPLHWPLEFPAVFASASPGFDAVIGNPPFLSQTASETAADRGVVAFRRLVLGPGVHGLADVASQFVLLSLALLKSAGGVTALVQPDSLLSTSDAAGVRAAVLSGGSVLALWVAGEHVFAAAVYTCAVIARTGRGEEPEMERFVGKRWRDIGPLPQSEITACGGGSWATTIADGFGIPAVASSTRDLMSAHCSATADFRDQYYGLAPFVKDASDEVAGEGEARLVTTGLIDPAHLRWGTTGTKFNKSTFVRPVIEIAALVADRAMQDWAARRLVPKLLVATQTKVIEVVIDEVGDLLPSVPVVTVTAPSERLAHVAAALSSPPVVAVAAARVFGAALSADAIKLSAKQLMELPAPSEGSDWDAGAAAFLAASRSTTPKEWREAMNVMATCMCRAYNVTNEVELMSWWSSRFPEWR